MSEVHPYTDEGITKLDVIERYVTELLEIECFDKSHIVGILTLVQELQKQS